MDGYDFHTVSLSVSRLAEYYDQHREHISTSITLTLLFRSLGAVIFGLSGDLYGRKYPMIINLIIIAALQLSTAYCATFKQFLGVRALFGIGMGGIWGLAASMGLESTLSIYRTFVDLLMLYQICRWRRVGFFLESSSRDTPSAI